MTSPWVKSGLSRVEEGWEEGWEEVWDETPVIITVIEMAHLLQTMGRIWRITVTGRMASCSRKYAS